MRDDYIAREIVGEPGAIREVETGLFEVEIGARRRHRRRRRRPTPQHALRQFLPAGGRGARRFPPARGGAGAVSGAGTGNRGFARPRRAPEGARSPAPRSSRRGCRPPARRTCGGFRARRRRFHQGRSRPRRPGLFAVRRARGRLRRGGAPRGGKNRTARVLRPQPQRPLRPACASRSRAPARPASSP